MSSSKNNKTSNLLDKTVSLTSIRDIELFEISLIQTIADLLITRDICICNFDNNVPYRLLRCVGEDKKVEIQQHDIEVPEQITRAINCTIERGNVFTENRDNLYQVVFPIYGLSGGIIGYLSITLPKELSDIEERIISSLLGIAHNFHALLEENQRDKLTGLLNRKTFDENILKIQSLLSSTTPLSNQYSGNEKRKEEKQGESKQFWLAILDVDHFKRVNDVFGHVYGDEVLLLLAQLMKSSFRTSDLLFRFGGEEFIVIIQVDSSRKAKSIFDRFRKAIECFEFPQVGKVTVSGGVTQIIDEYTVSSDIVGKADQALYYAKDNGRNQICFFEDLLVSGALKEVVISSGGLELF